MVRRDIAQLRGACRRSIGSTSALIGADRAGLTSIINDILDFSRSRAVTCSSSRTSTSILTRSPKTRRAVPEQGAPEASISLPMCPDPAFLPLNRARSIRCALNPCRHQPGQQRREVSPPRGLGHSSRSVSRRDHALSEIAVARQPQSAFRPASSTSTSSLFPGRQSDHPSFGGNNRTRPSPSGKRLAVSWVAIIRVTARSVHGSTSRCSSRGRPPARSSWPALDGRWRDAVAASSTDWRGDRGRLSPPIWPRPSFEVLAGLLPACQVVSSPSRAQSRRLCDPSGSAVVCWRSRGSPRFRWRAAAGTAPRWNAVPFLGVP